MLNIVSEKGQLATHAVVLTAVTVTGQSNECNSTEGSTFMRQIDNNFAISIIIGRDTN